MKDKDDASKLTRREAISTVVALGACGAVVSLTPAASQTVTHAENAKRETDMTIPTPEPRIARFEKLAYGMFMHWGLYSQLGRGEWVQHMEKIPREEYAKLKDTFTAKDFDGRAVARVARNAGMKYITLTTRHHEGFSLYDTRGVLASTQPSRISSGYRRAWP